jgi:hypothetical protein
MSARNHACDENAAGFIKRHPLASFFGLAFAGSWALAVILRVYLQATGTPVTMTQAGPVALLILGIADVFPKCRRYCADARQRRQKEC